MAGQTRSFNNGLGAAAFPAESSTPSGSASTCVAGHISAGVVCCSGPRGFVVPSTSSTTSGSRKNLIRMATAVSAGPSSSFGEKTAINHFAWTTGGGHVRSRSSAARSIMTRFLFYARSERSPRVCTCRLSLPQNVLTAQSYLKWKMNYGRRGRNGVQTWRSKSRNDGSSCSSSRVASGCWSIRQSGFRDPIFETSSLIAAKGRACSRLLFSRLFELTDQSLECRIVADRFEIGIGLENRDDGPAFFVGLAQAIEGPAV